VSPPNGRLSCDILEIHFASERIPRNISLPLCLICTPDRNSNVTVPIRTEATFVVDTVEAS